MCKFVFLYENVQILIFVQIRTSAENQALAEEYSDQRVLIFFRHLYYVRVPYVYGEPKGSWSVDSAVLRDAQSWRRFFREQRIAWVLRAPEYPKKLGRRFWNSSRRACLCHSPKGK